MERQKRKQNYRQRGGSKATARKKKLTERKLTREQISKLRRAR
jgi:hypothetical protein